MIFTIAAVLTNVTALIVGPTLDMFGPRICGIVGAVLITVACFILRAAWLITVFDGYVVGYTFLAVGGPFTFISSFQLSNSFPNASGLILALLTGAFDASSAVFLCYRILYDRSGGTFHLSNFFTYFLAVPVFILLVQIFIMPNESYSTLNDLALEAMEADDDDCCDSEASTVNETTGLLQATDVTAAAGNYTDEIVVNTPGTVAITKQDGAKHDPHHNPNLDKISGVWGVLHGYSVTEQLKTPWFYLMAMFTTVQMLRINYFVATVLSQYVYLLGSYEKAVILNKFFDVALPLGGIIGIPFIGLILDNFSTLTVLTILLSTTSVIGLLGLVPNSFLAAYLNVALLVVYRPFYYTTVSDYAAKVFGFETFGRVYGVIISMAGIFNLLQATLDKSTHTVFKGNPIPVNVLLLTLTVTIGVTFLLYIRSQLKSIKRQQLEASAVNAPVEAMP